MNVTQKNATINFAQLKKENEQFTKRLMTYDARHEKMWSAISGGPNRMGATDVLYIVLGIRPIYHLCPLLPLQIADF